MLRGGEDDQNLIFSYLRTRRSQNIRNLVARRLDIQSIALCSFCLLVALLANSSRAERSLAPGSFRAESAPTPLHLCQATEPGSLELSIWHLGTKPVPAKLRNTPSILINIQYISKTMGEHIGYGAVAATMASDRDLSIFRRFGMLNTRNLLYLQSELMSLETRLQELDAQADDVKKGNATWSIPRSWYYLEHDDGEHLATVLRIREVLEKYSMSAYSGNIHPSPPIHSSQWGPR